MASVNNDPAPKQPKLLLVDDREDNLLSIEAVLAPDGYQFFRAYSGQQALKILLHEVDFAMILMDVKMPALNGFETASLIYEREKLRHIPIIFISANNYGDENVFKGYKAGGIDYILKPINPEVLRAKVAVFIDIYKKNAMLNEQEQKLLIVNKSLEREISELKTTDERTRQLNAKLQTEISTLASMLLSSKGASDCLEFETCDLNLLLKNLTIDIEDRISKMGATVLIESLPSVKASRILMRPLFGNLISNALSYSKKDVMPVIKIRSEISQTASSSSKYCQIIIENNSINLDQKTLDGLFLDSARHNGKTFSVDNLVLCKKIMELHNGFIEATDKSEGGSTFIISFPMPSIS